MTNHHPSRRFRFRLPARPACTPCAHCFGVAPLPQFALQQGDTKIAGILGMDTLYICHTIIDLDGMGLFLK
jgi:hypothetical protein